MMLLIKNNIQFSLAILLLTTFSLGASNSEAAAVYVDSGTIFITDGSISSSFSIDSPGVYQANLTYGFDINYPGSADVLGISITDPLTNSVLGEVIGVGSFTFSAQAGQYDFSVFTVPNVLFTTANYSVTVSPVPLPATLLLFLTSILSLFGFKKRSLT